MDAPLNGTELDEVDEGDTHFDPTCVCRECLKTRLEALESFIASMKAPQ